MFFVSKGNIFVVYFTTLQLVLVPCGSRRTSPRSGTFIVVFCFNCHVVFHFLMFFFNDYVSWSYIQLSLGNSSHLFGKELSTLLVVCSFCGCFIVFVCFSLWSWGLDVDLILLVPEFSYPIVAPTLSIEKVQFQF